MNILFTGGAGYIGSHTLVAALQQGNGAVVLDNFCNSSPEVLRRVEQITGISVICVEGDVRDNHGLARVFSEHAIDAVIHFAGLKAVVESLEKPLAYYDTNVGGTIALLQAMERAGVYRLVFSSSATVYGEAKCMPVSEDQPTGQLANPYGRSKLMVEHVLQDLSACDARWSIGVLRYFNPVGAHPSGLIGEDPRGIPNNLLPYIAQVAVGRLPILTVHGGDYPTHDGTGVRDYIHVSDLARGHLAAIDYLNHHAGINIWNLGTGLGYSVLDVIQAFEEASKRKIPYTISSRRQGDVAECWADPSKAWKQLGWKAQCSLAEMMMDHWRWQQANPTGYGREV